METAKVILVDENDQQVGEAGKMQAHTEGLLHRAFSIFIVNKRGEMLLQQRALQKYHSGGLWTNACCSHPSPGEDTEAAAKRRLNEELGFEVPVKKIFDFTYKAQFENGLTEYEFDHVFIGQYDGNIYYNTDEVMAICYKPIEEIKELLLTHPQQYTPWFHLAFPKIEQWYNEQLKEQAA